MRIFKKILTVVLAVLLILTPIVFPTVLALSLPPQYDATYFGALDEKYDRLTSLDGEKIVVIGGSSVAFGLDSERLERYTGMPVVNFGLYADLGTKMMLDLSLSGIGRGDVVILSPELDAQTLSLYFNSRSALTAIDSDYSMLSALPLGDIVSCIGSMWGFSLDKWQRYRSGQTQPLDSIYRSEYFNEYGDFALERPASLMPIGYDPNNMIDLSADALGADFLEFCDYLNDYIKKCERRGARVLFSYPPMNELGIEGTEADRAELCALLEENIDCTFISDIDDCILEAGYFYDSNYHLNDSGVTLRTLRLAKDIRMELGILENPINETEPAAPALPFDPADSGAEDVNARYFIYELNAVGAYTVVGLTEEGKSLEKLTLPRAYNGKKVIYLAEGALAGSGAHTLVIPSDSQLVTILNGAFIGASSLERLEIYKADASDIKPPTDFSGVAPDFRIHVPAGSGYGTDYFWSELLKTQADIFVYDLEIG